VLHTDIKLLRSLQEVQPFLMEKDCGGGQGPKLGFGAWGGHTDVTMNLHIAYM
jgi:hypothetical protein